MSIPQKSKEEIVKSEIKNKQYYTVKIEAQAPIHLTYKILAESPQQALEQVEKQLLKSQSEPPKIIWSQIRKLIGRVYQAGTISLLHFKELK